MEIKIFRFRYLSAVFGIVLGAIFILLGILSYSVLIFILGAVFIIISSFFLKKYLSYKLILSLGRLEERQNGKMTETTFAKVTQLDCELVLQADNVSITPVFHLLDKENNEKVLKLRGEASLLTISQWLIKNFPEAKFSGNTQKVLSWKKHSPSVFIYLFGSM